MQRIGLILLLCATVALAGCDTPRTAAPDAAIDTPRSTTGMAATPAMTDTIDATPTADVTATTPVTASPLTSAGRWSIRSVDTMKVSRDTLKRPLTDRAIAAVVALDARLRLTHVTADVYYDDPAYLGRWVRAIRAAGLRVWFRSHWYAWEDHRDLSGTMSPATLGSLIFSGAFTNDAYYI